MLQLSIISNLIFLFLFLLLSWSLQLLLFGLITSSLSHLTIFTIKIQFFYHAPHNWTKLNPNPLFILFPSPVHIASTLFSCYTNLYSLLYASIHIHLHFCISSYHLSFLIFVYYISHFTIFSSRFFQILIFYLCFYLCIWFHFTLPSVLCMLNHAIYRYYYI